jgi:hypothetical protein
LHVDSIDQTVKEEEFQNVVLRIDAANGADPERTPDGVAAAVVYSERMSTMLTHLVASPSFELRLAIRAQHIERWRIPRATYPSGRGGYLRWRADLARMHADRVGELMREEGCADSSIARVQSIVMKKNRGHDPEAQVLTDCACLVFLEHGLRDFLARTDEAKLVPILRKTWEKMSEKAQRLALGFELEPQARALLGTV